MGVSDFRRGPKRPDRKGGEEDAFEASLGQDPRPHHYILAHVALRQLGLGDPLKFLAILGSEDARGFMEHIFEAVCQEVPEDRPGFSAEEVKVHCCRVGCYPCALIEMPQPETMTEAFFTALVMLKEIGTDFSEGEEIPARYFTLEKGCSDDGNSRTVLCEWTAEAHLNYGEGPEPTPAAFCAAMEGALSESG